MKNIGYIVGSLRKGAYTRLLSQAVCELAPQSFKMSEIGIGELPLYNQDLETATPPTQWVSFRDQVKSCDAIVFITPEYNRGLPGALKNAIDVGSRPIKESVWKGRPALIMSLTPGKLGAMAAHQQLRLGLSVIGVPVMPLPELYLPNAGELFDGGGKLVNEDTRKLLATALNEFETWIGRFK
ncbi:NAD(P)H-dependent oxidoreductase [Steroidobacter sp. S1-65]|uniref:NAD(P)H-dependent oxidoreductase n=1 Tax=Steroidobacter gossypii TaxID=2805490 RepID=A0ABS1X3A0_9GAMM|nr:NAD(P)H-dependent oxidoreductase [Steroidobacter gossypii]MBM0107700.1 NAD(P)H-dependent oxidoreductase [Steroidobacter gossypii]